MEAIHSTLMNNLNIDFSIPQALHHVAAYPFTQALEVWPDARCGRMHHATLHACVLCNNAVSRASRDSFRRIFACAQKTCLLEKIYYEDTVKEAAAS